MIPPLRIMIADDDGEDRIIIMDAFKELYPSDIVQFVEDGIELLQTLDKLNAAGEELPSRIVLDLNMPRLNGAETLRRLKAAKEYSHIPAIILSTSSSSAQKSECILLGAAHYLTKPSTYRQSLQIVEFIHNFATQTTEE